MNRVPTLALLLGLVVASVATAQPTPWRFRWQTGQVLTYRVEQTTTIQDVVGERKTNVINKLNLVKRWEVREIDASGVATLHLTLASMRNEITRPNGEVLSYDSAAPEKGTPELAEQLSKYVGRVLAVLQVDGRGNVVAVKESKHGPASRYESDLPFKILLAEGAVSAGTTWDRNYKVTLDPPVGTGETFAATQRYECKAVEGTLATVSLTTEIAKLPESLLDQIPLLQSLPTGEVVFDTQSGFLKSARLRIDKELKGHQGEGSSYRFQSSYTEEQVTQP